MVSLRMASGIHVCASDEGAVILDLVRDAYVGLSTEQSVALSTVVVDWPPVSADISVPEDEAASLAREMIARGFLEESTASAPTRPERPPIVTSELIRWDRMRWRHVRAGHVFRFVQSLMVALWILRFGGLPRAVRRAGARKAARQGAGRAVDLPSMQSLVSSYFHVRTLFYAPKGRCLLDSIVLLEFLARYHIFATWITGVQIRPFAAHTWVQSGTFVLNGTPDYVRAYRPILSV